MAAAGALLFKVVVIGASGVGKTCLLRRLVRNSFAIATKGTIGVDVDAWMMRAADGRTLTLSVWDTAGNERFRSVAASYYRGAAACVLVYDIAHRRTFDALPQWLAALRESSTDATLMLIGNKADMRHVREVPTATARAYAESIGAFFLEASALDADNVEEAFRVVGADLAARTLAPAAREREHGGRGGGVGGGDVILGGGGPEHVRGRPPCCH